MTEALIKKIEEQLKCSICLETYKEPKLLQCFHVYCMGCLVRLVVKDQLGAFSLCCPICRQVTPVLPGGVFELKSAFRVKEFLEILVDLKKSSSASLDVEKKVDITSLTKLRQRVHHCSEHIDKELEFFCETCDELVCSHCVFKKQKHHAHDFNLINSSFDSYVEEISMFLCPMENQMTRVNATLEKVDTCFQAVADQRVHLEENIRSSIQELRNALNVREDELVAELNHIVDDKRQDLMNQRRSLEITLSQLKSCFGFVRESLQTSSLGDVLKMKKTIVKQAIELSTVFPPKSLEPCTDANITFSLPSDSRGTYQTYGSIHSVADPLRCHVSGNGLEEAKVGETSTVLLETMAIKSESDHERFAASLECELLSENTEVIVSGDLERTNGNYYRVSYQPTIKGKHQLQIKLQNKHIAGSPFPIIVSATETGNVALTPVVVCSVLKEPCGLTVNKENKIVVSDLNSHCISIFSSSGELVRTFGTRGFKSGDFQFPRGVTVDAKDNILVTDSINQRIQKFTKDGKFVTAVGTTGSGKLQFKYPTDIAFNISNDQLYVVDDNHRVQILDTNLKFVDTFGKYGNGKGQFKGPWSIACDNSGRVYVADVNTQRIQVFTAEGQFLRSFNRQNANGQVSLAVDSKDCVYVCDKLGHRVSVFSSGGLLLSSFGSEGVEVGQLKSPLGLAVDDNGFVFVCDSGNGRIQMYI